MNILIFGATGRVGMYLVKSFLKDRHHVTVLVRSPEKIKMTDENLTILKGNVLNKSDITLAMQGNEIVISALSTDGTTTLSKSMPLIVQEMNNKRIKRIVTIGTADILQSRITPNLLRYHSSESKRKSTRAAKEHHKVYEILKQSDLNWTIICPTYMPDGNKLGRYRIEPNFLPVGGIEISVQDTADFTYNLIKRTDYLMTRVGIAY